MKNIWKTLLEAFGDDDEDLGSLVGRAKSALGNKDEPKDLVRQKLDFQAGKKQPPPPPQSKTKSSMFKIGSGEPDDNVQTATSAAGLKVADPKIAQQKTDNQNVKDMLRAERYADQIIGITDRSDLKDIITVFANSMEITHPLTPGQMVKYVGRLEHAYTEIQAKKVLMDLAKELREKNK